MPRQPSSLVLIVSLTGCLLAPRHEAPASGAVVKVWTTPPVHRRNVSYPVKGSEPVSDDDLFRIVETDHRAVSRSRAELAADRYAQNLQKASEPSMSLGGRF